MTLYALDLQAGQVFAVCSAAAQQPLVEARTADGALAIAASRVCLPAGCHSVHFIPPGHIKTSFSSTAQRIGPARSNQGDSVFMSASAGRPAPASPFLGLQDALAPQLVPSKGSRSPIPASTPSSASSMYTSTNPPDEEDDSETQTPTSGSLQEAGSYKKTRRGKRAGRNLKMRNAESELRRASSDIRRGSMDLHRSSYDSQVVSLLPMSCLSMLAGMFCHIANCM